MNNGPARTLSPAARSRQTFRAPSPSRRRRAAPADRVGRHASTVRRAPRVRRRGPAPAADRAEDQHAVVGQQAGAPVLQGEQHGVGQRLRAEGRVAGAAQAVAAKAGDHVVERRDVAAQAGEAGGERRCACTMAPASARSGRGRGGSATPRRVGARPRRCRRHACGRCRRLQSVVGHAARRDQKAGGVAAGAR
jgi:hypothetical protein